MTGQELRAAMRWIRSGRSARRALLNVELARGLPLKGRVLDVGGRGQPTYSGLVGTGPSVTWTVIDIAPGARVDVATSVEALPFPAGAFDAALCFNVLEHVWDYQRALGELARVLKPDGALYGSVPLICEVHGAPSDYWRFTRPALERCLARAGLQAEALYPHGGVMAACFDLCSFAVSRVPPVRALLGAGALLADRALARLRPAHAERFALGYYFVARPAPGSR